MQINTLAKNSIIEQLKKEFKEREFFSRVELLGFYRQFEPNLKETTFRWNIHYLKINKIITPVSRELFTLVFKPHFEPEIGKTEKSISTKIEKQFSGVRQCIWSTKAVNEFMLHIPGKFITILQVEKGALEPVYEFLKAQKFQDVFILPNKKEIERYVYETESAIILQPLISKAPTQKVNMVTTTTIEKMIVDLFCDKNLFSAFQGSELVHIVNNAHKRYSIDYTRLVGYAKRRRKADNLLEFLSEKTDFPKNILYD